MVSRFVAGKVQDALLGRDIRLTITGAHPCRAMKLINVLGYQLVNDRHDRDHHSRWRPISTFATPPRQAMANRCRVRLRPDRRGSTEGVGELLIKTAYIHTGAVYRGKDIGCRADDSAHTGDVGRIDSTGRLWPGRLKEVIIDQAKACTRTARTRGRVPRTPHRADVTGIDTGRTSSRSPWCLHLGDALGSNERIAELAEAFRANGALPVYKKVQGHRRARTAPRSGIKVARQLRRMIEQAPSRSTNWTCTWGPAHTGRGGRYRPPVLSAGVEEEPNLRAIKDEIKAILPKRCSPSGRGHHPTPKLNDLGGDSLSSLAVFIKAEENTACSSATRTTTAART